LKEPRAFNFIVIDDDYVNNLICSSLLRAIYPQSDLKTFLKPEEGLAYIASLAAAGSTDDVIMLLDINMPTLTGWDVLEQFEEYPAALKAHFRIYILSSSIAREDKRKAREWTMVAGFIEKPLTIEAVRKLLS
jgi:CheY-like chemotaxis protein